MLEPAVHPWHGHGCSIKQASAQDKRCRRRRLAAVSSGGHECVFSSTTAAVALVRTLGERREPTKRKTRANHEIWQRNALPPPWK
jgi:hypothetical protein